MSVKREDERAEIRWKLWLGEKAILVWARLTEIVGMTQALYLPLHEAITKSRVINSGWNFMLIICACKIDRSINVTTCPCAHVWVMRCI